MNEAISTIINNLIQSFDFTYCLIVNIAVYVFIKTYNDLFEDKVLHTWGKRVVLLVTSIIIGIIYYTTGTSFKLLFNSFILAPVSWSWVLKPICDKFKIGYNDKTN